jgi:phosphoribosylformylglycinamidine synthase subunit PurSL
MAHRIEVISTIPDARAGTRLRDLQSREFRRLVNGIELVDVYTLDGDFPVERLNKVRDMLTNPVSQSGRVDDAFMPDFNYAVEIGFLPGVTDNVGNTAREGVSNLLDIDSGLVHSSQLMFLRGGLSASDAQRVGEAFANPLIQSIRVRDYASFFSNEGMGVYLPRVRIDEIPSVGLVDILGADDEELGRIGKLGIANEDGSRRGPLALDLTYMNAIRDHFQALGRNPTDVELESLGQTWSEHCKHTIFADPIDEIGDGLYEHFIKRATSEIRGAKGVDDFCVSVFTDNSGAIDFDDRWLITDKVETHNSPSALDPFGGSITGIVGVNRDAIGSGLGAMPVANRFGFCFADPNDERPLYKGEGKTQRMLSSRRIMDGVIDGVNVGGNQSGIPTPQGFAYYDERFKGKPLVFVGTVGLMPRESAGRLSHEKSAEPGDYAVMIGGRVGKDGIHGATFSSEAMDSDSPVGAVQIGDPITQKKLSDAVVREARDRGLYTSITDNGAGGLSCSVAEMAKESGGCRVDLDKVPLKYEGMQPWEIWVSESQERMTLSVPPSKWEEFSGLMKRRGVEATVIGEFNDSGNCVVDYDGNTVMDMKMSFLHDGLPRREINTTFSRGVHDEPEFDQPDSLNGFLHSMLARNNMIMRFKVVL